MLQQYQGYCLNLKKQVNLIENLSRVCELTLLGDKKEQEIFDYFIEEKILDYFMKALKLSKDTEVVNAILQNLGMLISNINNNLILLLSNPLINEFIIFPYNFNFDETLDYYINFLKILSQRLTAKNLHLFFNQRYAYFPLLVHSQNFCDHKDHLIRTTSHNILLTILSNIRFSEVEQQLISYVNQYPFLQIVINYVLLMRDKWFDWCEDQVNKKDNLDDVQKLFKDIYDNCPFLENSLDNIFLHFVILPITKQCSNRSILIIKNLFQFPFSQSLLYGITTLLFSQKIPKIPFKVEEIKKLVTSDPDLQDICVTLFCPKQQQKGQWPRLFAWQYVLPSEQIKKLTDFNLIQKLNQQQLFSENIIDSHQTIYNQYHIYAIYISEDQILMKSGLSIMFHIIREGYYMFTSEERYLNIINLFSLARRKSTTVENCILILEISRLLIHINQMTKFLKAYFLQYIIKGFEKTLAHNNVDIFYHYFDQILDNLDNVETLGQILIKEPITQQIIKLLLFYQQFVQFEIIRDEFKINQLNIIQRDEIKQFTIEIQGLQEICEINQDSFISHSCNIKFKDWVVVKKDEMELIFYHIVYDDTLEIKIAGELFSDFYQEILNRKDFCVQQYISHLICVLHKFYQ